MKIVLAAIAAIASLFVAPSAASAADGDACSADTPGVITETEMDELRTGIAKFEVKRMTGDLGVKNQADSSNDLLVRVFRFCEFGVDAGPFRLSFDREQDGRWRMAVDQD